MTTTQFAMKEDGNAEESIKKLDGTCQNLIQIADANVFESV